MISEPEMAEGFASRESREVEGDVVQQSPPGLRRRKSWLWALGGASVASVLWGAGFLLSPSHQDPDLRGYRLDQKSCRSARLASLQKALALKSVPDSTEDEVLKHPALDQLHCSLFFQRRSEVAGGHWAVTTAIGVSVALHKKTDPRDEFEADRRVTDSGVVSADKVKRVADLGDEAFLIAKDLEHTELRVLDGAAVVKLTLATGSYYDGDLAADTADAAPELPDVSTYWPAMISDARELTSVFRHP
ncbi:hypothetical protein SAMN06272735_8829 [Streptomyces sp. TLI_55]|uniref:hypothetical protein n=1 Tax=Streptomyces sp. TLI_55 TaxID=1938861 RepID=UPI000BC66DCE|nr:hypothetical protein [Streptomyces sp. TLI_55]SNX88384.1 hypothetical protein SAMN06272735_8829 [Streptomyces sp. TLI_55]